MHRIAIKFDKEFLLPFILLDLVISPCLIVSICLHSKEFDMFYCISLVSKKTLKVARCGLNSYLAKTLAKLKFDKILAKLQFV